MEKHIEQKTYLRSWEKNMDINHYDIILTKSAKEDLTEHEEIVLSFGYDYEVTIQPQHKLEKCSGDLKIIKENAVVFIDCAEVKYMIIHRRFL